MDALVMGMVLRERLAAAVGVPVRGVPVAGAGKRGRRFRCSAHGERAEWLSHRYRRKRVKV